MVQCVNTYCLHSQNDDALFCERCGCSTVVDERLLVTKLLSKGSIFSSAQTQTFEAVDLETQQAVILRVVHSANPAYVAPLKNAAIALNQVHSIAVHPGLMQLVEEDYYFSWQIRPDEPASHCMVSEKIDGINLHAWLAQNGAISERLATNWMKQLLNAIKALHECNFLHRDIKPENIIVTAEQHLVLIDFDAICPLTDGFNKLTAIGTPMYMAAEQRAGEPRPSSDLYSIGRVMTELLTGKDPIEVARTATGAIDWLKESPKLSQPFTVLINRLAHANTLHRPPDAVSALNYLAEFEATVAPPRRWRLLDSAISKTVLVLLGISMSVGLGAISFSQPQPESDRLLAEGNQLILYGDIESGLGLLEQASSLEPNSVDIRASLAFAQTFVGDFVSAIENFKVALSMAPEDPYLLYNLANVYEETDMQQAIAYYKAASDIDSSLRLDALNNLARAYLLTDQLQQAEKILSGLTDVESPLIRMAVFKNLGWLNYEKGNLDIAQEQLNKALEADYTQPDPYCLLALIKQKTGQDDYADRISCLYTKVLIEKPEVAGWKAQLDTD